MKLLFLVVNVIYLNFVFCLWEENAGPYRIKPSNNFLKMCEKLGRNSTWVETKLRNYNETHSLLSGNATINIELNNNMWIRALMQYKPKGSNKWNSILSVNMKICDAIERYVKKIITEILANAGVKYTCPLSKGVHHVNDYLMNLDEVANVPILPYGFSKCQLQFLSMKRKRKVLETCIDLFFEIVPKE